jgi:hypothetical protein
VQGTAGGSPSGPQQLHGAADLTEGLAAACQPAAQAAATLLAAVAPAQALLPRAGAPAGTPWTWDRPCLLAAAAPQEVEEWLRPPHLRHHLLLLLLLLEEVGVAWAVVPP